jgi:hypothetical protein
MVALHTAIAIVLAVGLIILFKSTRSSRCSSPRSTSAWLPASASPAR